MTESVWGVLGGFALWIGTAYAWAWVEYLMERRTIRRRIASRHVSRGD